MTVRTIYRQLSSLSAEQRALLARRLQESGLARPQDEILPRPPGSDPVPASLVQQRLWLLDRLEPANPFYNLPLICLALAGPLDSSALAAALDEIERRHEALRTVFAEHDGTPVQVVLPVGVRQLPLVDLTALPEQVRGEAAWHLGVAEALRPFDLAAGPLWRTTLVRLDAEHHHVFIEMHHIVTDAWSLAIFFRELTLLYNGLRAGRPAPLPEPLLQYADFSLWQRQRMNEAGVASEIAFWRGQLDGAPEPIELPTDRPRPARRTFEGRRLEVGMPPELPGQLRAWGHETGASLYMVLLTAYIALLHRYNGRRDLVVGSPVAGRGTFGTEGMIGFFVNTVVLRVRWEGDPGFRALTRLVRNVVLDVYEHQELPFDRLVEELQPRRTTSYNPIIQAMFALQNAGEMALGLDGLQAGFVPIDTRTSQTDLVLFAGMAGPALGALEIEYATDLFDFPTIARMEGHLLRLIAGAFAEPERPFASLDLLSAAERHQLAAEWAPGLRPRAPHRPEALACLHHGFARVARTCPEAPAVESFVSGGAGGAAWGDQAGVERLSRLTYGELDRRANQLARRLRAAGAGPEARVALCLERTPLLVVAILGVAKAGAAYLPLDPESPAERLRYTLEDAGACMVLTTRELAAKLPQHPPVWALDEAAEALAGEPASDPEVPVDLDNTLYVIYTSGSTGRPKGTLVSHRNVASLFAAARERFDFGPRDAWSLFHSYAFDFSVWEMWGALLHGGRLVVVPRELTRSPAAFDHLLHAAGITVLNQTPSAFKALLEARQQASAGAVAGNNGGGGNGTPRVPGGSGGSHGDRAESALRWIIFGGEALAPASLRPWFESAPGDHAQLVNMYGITETTVHVTFRRVTRADLPPLSAAGAAPGTATEARPEEAAGSRLGSPIGRPLPGMEVVVLDGELGPVPAGVPGEVFVGGSGLATGYLGQPARTAERFLPHPWSAAAGARLYRTGDLARFRHDGEVEYLGRIDQQVKIRGLRIELGEIEAALSRHPGVSESVVVAREQAGEEVALVAYVVAGGEPAPSHGEVRRFLAESLPDYMLPAATVVLERMPLNANGKVDRRALPLPDSARPELEGGFVAPRTPFEETLAEVWRELLGLDEIGIHDDFFDLGGHSLLATRLAFRLRSRLGLEVGAPHVFAAPTIATMAVAFAQLPRQLPADPPAPPAPAGDRGEPAAERNGEGLEEVAAATGPELRPRQRVVHQGRREAGGS